jgi:hypothetical protein
VLTGRETFFVDLKHFEAFFVILESGSSCRSVFPFFIVILQFARIKKHAIVIDFGTGAGKDVYCPA